MNEEKKIEVPPGMTRSEIEREARAALNPDGWAMHWLPAHYEALVASVINLCESIAERQREQDAAIAENYEVEDLPAPIRGYVKCSLVFTYRIVFGICEGIAQAIRKS